MGSFPERYNFAFIPFHVICQERWIRASPRGPNTEKQIKARGKRLSAFVFLEVFGTRDEARSPIF